MKVYFNILIFVAQFILFDCIDDFLLALGNVTVTLKRFSQELNIINFQKDSQFINDLIARYLKDDCVVVINGYKDKEYSQIQVENSAILAFDSFADFKEFNEYVNFGNLTNNSPKKLRFFVLCSNVTFNDIKSLEERDIEMRNSRKGKLIAFYEMSDILQFQYFLVEEKSSIGLFTFVWYTAYACHVPQLIEVNRFDKTNKMWKNSDFVIEKFSNFNGCKLTFTLWPQGYAANYEIKNGVVSLFGYNVNITQGLAKHLNYTYEFNVLFNGIPKSPENVTDDLILLVKTFNAYYEDRIGPSFITSPYVFQANGIAVPPGENYSSYEKLLLPFDFQVWILIIFSFLTAFSTIFVIYLKSKTIQSFVFGSNVRTPSLNVAAIFFGLSQFVSPKRNFARFFMTMFVLYSLVIRTCYQGKIYEFMQKNMSKPHIESIDKMIENNYTFYLMEIIPQLYPDIEVVKR